jgi:hypothetical protein
VGAGWICELGRGGGVYSALCEEVARDGGELGQFRILYIDHHDHDDDVCVDQCMSLA